MVHISVHKRCVLVHTIVVSTIDQGHYIYIHPNNHNTVMGYHLHMHASTHKLLRVYTHCGRVQRVISMLKQSGVFASLSSSLSRL